MLPGHVPGQGQARQATPQAPLSQASTGSPYVNRELETN